MAIEAAIEILESEGLNALSTRKVAKQIGYTVGTLYLVFKNLDELILEINAATLDELHTQLNQQSGANKSPQQYLKNMALAYLHYAQQHNARWSLLFSHKLPDGVPVPQWFEQKVTEVFVNVQQPLKHIRSDLTEQQSLQASRELWSGVHGACDLGLNGKLSFGVEFKPEALIESLIENYLTGYAKQ